MSAPVSHNDKKNADGPGFYAPPGVRRSPASDKQSASQPVAPQSVPPPATVPDCADGGGERLSPVPAPAVADTLPMAPQIRAAATEGDRAVRSELAPVVPAARMACGIGGPNLECPPALTQRVAKAMRMPAAPPAAEGAEFDRPPRSQPPLFVGDIAVVALRRRLALDPGLALEPPALREPQRRRSLLQALLRLTAFVLGAAIVALGLTSLSLPDIRPREVRLPAVKQDKVVASGHLLTGMSMPTPATTRLVVEGRQAFANEPLPLGISLTGTMGGEFALLTGLATGTRFSTGSPIGNDGWRLPASDLTRAFAFAPQNFVGVMQAAVDLRAGNDTLIDSQVMRLQWMPKQLEVDALPSLRDGDVVKPAAVAALAATPAPPLDPEELATLVRRGQDFIKTGDLAAARLVLRRAVTTDDAQAALALATTFDPLVFGELGVLGFQPDLAQARTWYERAAQLGSQEAQRRLDRLARLPP